MLYRDQRPHDQNDHLFPHSAASPLSHERVGTKDDDDAHPDDAKEEEYLSHRRFHSTTSASASWRLHDFDIGRKLGEGRFGKIYLAREKETKYAVVLKCISKEMILRYDMQHQIQREIELHMHCRHSNILRMLAYFWDDTRIFLVLDYAEGGDLYTLQKKQPHGVFSETLAINIVAQLVKGVAYMHRHRILHRDLKPDNVLLKKGVVKIADLTWAVLCHPGVDRRRTICGTLDYLSPELLEHKPYDGSVDVWSLGIVAYELLYGCPPFERCTPSETVEDIKKGSVMFPPNRKSSASSPYAVTTISEEARDFILCCLNPDVKKRVSAADLAHHRWLQPCLPSNNEALETTTTRTTARGTHTSKDTTSDEVRNNSLSTAAQHQQSFPSQLLQQQQSLSADHHSSHHHSHRQQQSTTSLSSAASLLNHREHYHHYPEEEEEEVVPSSQEVEEELIVAATVADDDDDDSHRHDDVQRVLDMSEISAAHTPPWKKKKKKTHDENRTTVKQRSSSSSSPTTTHHHTTTTTADQRSHQLLFATEGESFPATIYHKERRDTERSDDRHHQGGPHVLPLPNRRRLHSPAHFSRGSDGSNAIQCVSSSSLASNNKRQEEYGGAGGTFSSMSHLQSMISASSLCVSSFAMDDY